MHALTSSHAHSFARMPPLTPRLRRRHRRHRHGRATVTSVARARPSRSSMGVDGIIARTVRPYAWMDRRAMGPRRPVRAPVADDAQTGRDGTGRDRGRVMSASRSTVGAIARQRGTTAHDRGVLLGDGASASADGGGGASGADGGGGTRAHGNASTSTSTSTSGSTAPVLTCELVVKALGVFLTVVAVIGGAVYASTRVEIDLYEDVMPHVKNPVKFFIFNVLIASFGVSGSLLLDLLLALRTQ